MTTLHADNFKGFELRCAKAPQLFTGISLNLCLEFFEYLLCIYKSLQTQLGAHSQDLKEADQFAYNLYTRHLRETADQLLAPETITSLKIGLLGLGSARDIGALPGNNGGPVFIFGYVIHFDVEKLPRESLQYIYI